MPIQTSKHQNIDQNQIKKNTQTFFSEIRLYCVYLHICDVKDEGRISGKFDWKTRFKPKKSNKEFWYDLLRTEQDNTGAYVY